MMTMRTRGQWKDQDNEDHVNNEDHEENQDNDDHENSEEHKDNYVHKENKANEEDDANEKLMTLKAIGKYFIDSVAASFNSLSRS